MYLEKLEIQGFKSFASKNILVFPGMLDKERRGLTAIVGPNGSGKSNTADAVRWVLGEQSMKTLRGKKSEDVIFSGSEKLGKLGMAEVSLYLNNEDRKAPIDFSQMILTRRVYRDGNSEYFLNNSRVRLADVQMLLAKANFGQRTYSVIGQGMVEGFLNTSLAERKEFFDEATGVKQFQIKRDESLNKLKLSLENLGQAQMLLNEIEPRLKNLTKQVHKLQKKEEMEIELKEIQTRYYGKLWHELKDKFNETNKNFLEVEKIKLDKERKLENINRELGQMEMQNKTSEEFAEWQRKSDELQDQKDLLTKKQAKLEAEMEIKLETSGQFDLAWLNNRKASLGKEIKNAKTEIGVLSGELKEFENELERLKKEKKELSAKVTDLNGALIRNSIKFDDAEGKRINKELKWLLERLSAAENGDDLGEIKNAIKEIREKLKEILALTEKFGDGENLEKIQEELSRAAQTSEEISVKINEASVKASSLGERKKMFLEKAEGLGNELNDVESKLKKYQKTENASDSGKESEKVKTQIAAVEQEIEEVKEKINNYSEGEKEKRQYIFELQKKIQVLQNEVNELNNRLNELKINSTRYETRLEDLETEIRNEMGGIRDAEKTKIEGPVDFEETQAKIHNLKRQLEAIGGLDPETEKEYVETKERYDFLSTQVNDLTSTIGSLEKIIKELDITIKEKFDKEFKLISQKFEEYFKILFNGGNAKIIKVLSDEMKDEEEDGQVEAKEEKKEDVMAGVYKKIKLLQRYNATGLAGIEIQATPPGKKIKSVSMLSGGERALTAIALISAIISANPSPFVVLDEVDAALDEANSERLAKILDDLSHKTQFIVITHNRASMRRANVLYGVTMRDDGVSKLLSVKLDYAESVAK